MPGPDFSAMVDRYLSTPGAGITDENVRYSLRTEFANVPYQHDMNDALIKLHLQAVQFAKNQGLMNEYIFHDVSTMRPVNARMGDLIRVTGNLELAVVAVAQYSTCHFQMVLDTPRKSHNDLRRTWVSPFKKVLDAGTRIGQFDLTEEWLHYNYTIPRFQGYAIDLGVEFAYSEWDDETREVWIQVKEK